MKHMRTPLLLGAGLAAFTAQPAFAEDAAEEHASGDKNGEIIVTAQFREATAQDTAISLEVISADSLADAGVTQATDLNRITPGVQLSQGGTAIQIFIRGAGDFSTTSYNDAAVAQSYDGIFAARTQWIAGTFYDLERVEILKGPQGTLYGRNATGGVMNILPVQPKLGENSGYLTGQIQNYDGYLAEGALNLALGDKAALRVSYQGSWRDGYISDGTDDDKHQSVRFQLKAEPTPDLTLRFGANYQHIGGRGHGQVVYEPTAPTGPGLPGTPIIPSDRWTSINDSLNSLIGQLAAPPGTYPIDTSLIRQDIDAWGINAHVDWDLGPATLTIIPAYQRVVNDSQSFPTLSFNTNDPYSGRPSTSDAQTLEVRLANSDGPLVWVLGGYYFNEDQDSLNEVSLGFVSDTAFVADLNTRAYAAFGEATYSVTDSFRLTAGLRYTDETKTVDAHRYAKLGSLACLGGGTGPGNSCELLTTAGTNVQGTYSANRLNFKLGVEYDVTPDNLLYATVATGFKSGGQANADLDPYKPEDVTAFTIGSKNEFGNGLVVLNLEGFYYEYRDRQENFAALDRGGAQVSSLFNAGKAVAKGASIEFTLRPSDNDTFYVGGEYVESEYKDFTYYNYRTASPDARTSCAVSAVPNGNAQIGYWEINCDGFQLPRTPKWSGSVRYNHSFPLANGGSVDFSPNMTFASSRWLSAEFVENARAKGYAVFNASLTYRAPDDRYSVQAFVRNIGDTAVYTGTQQYPFIANYNGLDIAPPRTYGVRVRYNF
ncbi:MAG: TonB-dependent receptor [Sphingomonadales bacterium]|nr:TonB-dependent receptor [Sphingomonadales bacterium]MBD3772607.1 TonB-dependent receptor [Paracoccaceae bacterium]